ncbi:MAG: hypothetical protein OEM41_08955 [Ignavibacteria bacterium]|nr:hypothetical protein [Ignavibacteria bacterium]
MENFLLIVQTVTLVFLALVCIAGFFVILKLRSILTGFGKNMGEISDRAIPVLENLEFVTARLKSITESIDDQVTLVGDSLGSIREVTDNIVALERKVQERIEGPILESIAFIAAILKGVKAFRDRIRD